MYSCCSASVTAVTDIVACGGSCLLCQHQFVVEEDSKRNGNSPQGELTFVVGLICELFLIVLDAWLCAWSVHAGAATATKSWPITYPTMIGDDKMVPSDPS